VKRPSAAQMERARRLLAHEGAAGSAEGGAATAAGRVYDKLQAHLAPLVGAAGVQSLLVRSAKLAQGDLTGLAAVSTFEGSTKLRERLEAQDSAVTNESAASLFATFLTLLTTFIGERLTTQILRSAWPTIEDTSPTETTK
jgi:hypothetical protein